MSFDVTVSYDEREKLELSLSFSCSSMWIFVHKYTGDFIDEMQCSYRVPLGALRRMASHINRHLEVYADAVVDKNDEEVKP